MKIELDKYLSKYHYNVDKGKYLCNICYKGFITEKGIDRHLYNKHGLIACIWIDGDLVRL